MQTTSADYKLEIKKPSRSFECKVTIGNNIYTNDDIVDIILETIQPGEGFSIGNTPSQTLDLTLLNRGDTIYSTSQVKVEIGLKIGSTIEYILMGLFNIDDIEKTDYTTKFTCYDNMIKFETPYFSNLGDTPTLQQVVNELATKTRVQFTGSLPAYTVKKLEGFTCREILGYVSSLCGGNALITRDGKFTIVTTKDIDYPITPDNYIDYKREEVKYKIGKVSCKVGDKELNKGSLGIDSMEVKFENPWVTDSILNDIYTKLNGFEYLGYTMKWQGDISLDVGDTITCTDIKGAVRKIPILSQKFTYNGGLTAEIGAKGETKNKNSFNSSGSGSNKLDRVVTELLIVNEALINKANIQDLEAVSIRTQTIEAKTAAIEVAIINVAHVSDLTAINANIEKLIAADAIMGQAIIGKANITDLTASVGRIEILESSVGDIETLVNGNLTSNNIQSLILSSDKVTVVNGFIKNAMIENLDVSKINAGDISVNKFRIKSDSGNLLIFDNTIQIKDSTRVRVQIGKDASNDYNMYVWDSSGKLMFDATGLKADGIKNKIIRDDMVSDNANISGDKLNISSVVTSINNGATTINSSKVLLDGTAQTLDVAFNTLTTKVDSAPPTIITDNSVTKLDGAIDGMLKINSISGRTLQNLFKPSTTTLGNETIGYWYYTNTYPIVDLGGKTITLVNPTVREIRFNIYDLNNTPVVLQDVSPFNKKVITLEANRKVYAVVGLMTKGWTEANKTELKGIVLEGDWTNKETPPYFEDIRSVGESENLELISCGKNLLNAEDFVNYIKVCDISSFEAIEDNEKIIDCIPSTMNLKPFMEGCFKENTQYTFKVAAKMITGNSIYFRAFYTDGTISNICFTSNLTYTAMQGTTVVNKTIKYLYISYGSGGYRARIKLDSIQLEEGTTLSQYEPYKEHRQPIHLTEPLRSLPNGIRDIVDFERGVVVRNVGKVVFDGGESWSIATSDPDNHIYTKVLKCKAGHNQYLICDKYSNSRVSWPLAPPNTVCTSSSSDGQIGFNFLIGTYTIATWKAELQANPITVYYQLATPVEEPIDVTQYMKQFNGGHFLTESSLINPTVDLTYSTSLASALSTMKEVTEGNTTALNIQQGKISALISNTTIIKDGQTIQLKDAYNSTVATVDSINSVISEHTSTINNLTGQVTGVETKTNEVRRDLDGTIEIVSQTKVTAESALSTATEAKQTADGFTQRVSNIETNYATTQAMNSAISQKADSIKSEVSKDFVSKNDATLTYATKASMELTANQLKLDFFSIDIINLLSNSSFSNRETTGWNMSGIGLYTGSANFFMPTDGWRAFSLTSDRGLLYQKGMTGERLPKRNSQYTFSLSSITESNIETFRLYIDYKLGASYVANQLINLKTGYNINRYSVTFTTKDINYDTFLLYIEVKPKAGTTGYRVFSIGLPCLSKGENGSYTARQNEVISGSTEIDANGVTIYNGAIDVRNRAGNSVLKGDANGNLMIRGNLYADPANPILHLFGGCSIDATANNELGVGSAVRLKWDENSYIRIDTGSTDIYQNGVARFRFYPNYLDCKPPTIYFADQCKIDASAGTFRFYISKSVDTGIRISPDGTISFMIAGTPRHVFNTNGTKAGGTIVVDGTTLGMSPIDSPKVLLEDVLFDIDIQEEGTTVSLDSTFLKTISTYAVFCSNPSVNIVFKDRTSFYVQGYTGKVDFRIIGYRIGYEEQYYQVVG